MYNTDHHVAQYCDGTGWKAMGKVGGSGAGGTGCTSPMGAEGQFIYNADYAVTQYCDGFIWRAMGKVSACPTNDTSPLHFTDLNDAFPLTDYTSDAVTVPCGYSNASATLVCDVTLVCTLSVNGGAAVGSATGINGGDVIRLQMKTPNSTGTVLTNTLTLGGVQADTWTISY